MATFDQLPAEQKAIIELVVSRGRSYDALADALGITAARVRELAREALVELSPRSAARVDDDRVSQVADYVLGQQSSAEASATKAHLGRSEASRSWAVSLLDALDEMYADGAMPEIPEPGDEPEERPARRRDRERDREPLRRERAREREPVRKRERERPRRAAGPLSPEAASAVRNRRIASALAGLVIAAAVVIGLIALLGGDDDGKKKASRPVQPRIVGQLLLNPINRGGKDQGIAIVAERNKERDLIVQARLTPTKQGQAYEVWLFNSPKDAVSIGAQVTDQQGNYQGAGKLPAALSRYKFIDVSLEKIDNNAEHSGNSVLRGAIANMVTPEQAAQAQQQQGGTGPTGPTGP